MEIILAILVVILAVAVAVLAVRKNTTHSEAQLQQLSDRIKLAASDAFDSKQKTLLDQTLAMINQAKQPFEQSVDKLQTSIDELEKKRVGDYHGLAEKLQSLAKTESELRAQTVNLSNALSNTNARGQWGELELKRTVELAGMTEYVDYDVQATSKNSDGETVRADMIIKLPGGKTIAVDSKVPMSAFLRANQIEGEDLPTPAQRQQYLSDHASALKKHVQELSKRKYFDAFEPSPEFVVLFLNIESSLKAALDADPTILEKAFEQKVIIATPTTLLALLKATAYGWTEATAQQRALEVMALGKELLDRLNTVVGHWQKVGENLERTVKSYNDARNSIKSRLFVTAQKIDQSRQWELPEVESTPLVDKS